MTSWEKLGISARAVTEPPDVSTLIADTLYGDPQWPEDATSEVQAVMTPAATAENSTSYVIGLVDQVSNARLVLVVKATPGSDVNDTMAFVDRIPAVVHRTVAEYVVVRQQWQDTHGRS